MNSQIKSFIRFIGSNEQIYSKDTPTQNRLFLDLVVGEQYFQYVPLDFVFTNKNVKSITSVNSILLTDCFGSSLGLTQTNKLDLVNNFLYFQFLISGYSENWAQFSINVAVLLNDGISTNLNFNSNKFGMSMVPADNTTLMIWRHNANHWSIPYENNSYYQVMRLPIYYAKSSTAAEAENYKALSNNDSKNQLGRVQRLFLKEYTVILNDELNNPLALALDSDIIYFLDGKLDSFANIQTSNIYGVDLLEPYNYEKTPNGQDFSLSTITATANFSKKIFEIADLSVVLGLPFVTLKCTATSPLSGETIIDNIYEVLFIFNKPIVLNGNISDTIGVNVINGTNNYKITYGLSILGTNILKVTNAGAKINTWGDGAYTLQLLKDTVLGSVDNDTIVPDFIPLQFIINTTGIVKIENSKYFAIGEFQVFKRIGINPNILEICDYVKGIVEGDYIEAIYLGGNIELKASFEIENSVTF